MNENNARPSTANKLARDRNLLSADRTLLAWLRTTLALLGFGFAIAQGYEYFESGYRDVTGQVIDSVSTPFYFGISFMALGLLGTFVGIIQYRYVLKHLRIVDPTFTEPRPFAVVAAILLLIIGAFGLLAVLL